MRFRRGFGALLRDGGGPPVPVLPVRRAAPMPLSLSLILGAVWVVAAAITAGLPMRRQYPPGITLLILAPVLIGYIGYEHGFIWVLIGLVAFGSMFRRPLIYFARKALGLEPKRPEDEE
jgi:hypothetical protein